MKLKLFSFRLINFVVTRVWILAGVASGVIGSASIAEAQICAPPPSGLVSWWRAEQNALDSADGNNGTLAGNVTYGAGRVGQSFVFDGNSDGVQLGNPTNLQLQNFTIEAWVKRANASRATQDPGNINGCILGYGESGYGFTLLDDGRLNLTQVEVGAAFSSALRITDTNFHHVALTKSDGTVVFYIDGIGETVAPYNPAFSFTTPVVIGARGDNLTTSFWGLIDEIAVFNRALAAAEIQSIYNAGSAGKCTAPAANCVAAPLGLVGWWLAEGNANDTAGTNHGTLQNGVSFVSGKVNTSFSFDGVGAVRVGESPSLTMSNAFSMEAWVFPTGPGANPEQGGVIVSKEGQYVLARFADGTIRWAVANSNPGWTWINSAFTAPVGQWTHVGWTYEAGLTKVFANGQLVHSYSGSGPVGNVAVYFPHEFWIGNRQDVSNSQRFQGRLDEISVYNRALGAGEVLAIYSAGSAGKCGSAPSIVAQPVSQTKNVGDDVTLTVGAIGASPLSYQWRFNGTNIVGAVNATLILTNIQIANSGNYSVVVANALDSVISSNSTLTVNTAICVPAPSGLVSWWAGQGNANDVLGINHGTLQNGATFAAGKVGQAFGFDGVGYVRVGESPSLTMSNAFSVEAWMFPTGPGGNPQEGGIVVSKEGQYVLARFADGTIRWGVANSNPGWTWVNSGFVAPIGQWTYVAWTYEAGLTKVFANGQLVHSYSGSGPVGNAPGLSVHEFWIGARQETSGSQRFQGRLDEVAVYNRALNAAEILAIYNAGGAGKCGPPPPITCVSAPSGVVSWWRAEGSATDSASGNNGVLQGGLTFGTGKVGQALSFDGLNDYLSVAPSATLNVGLSGGLTLEFWIKPADLSIARPLLEWDNNSGQPYGVHFWLSESGSGGGVGSLYANLMDTGNTDRRIASAGGILNTNEFQHVAVTYDKTTGIATLYYNGTVVAAQNLGSFTPQTSGPLYIGERHQGAGTGTVYRGLMDEVGVYGRALSTAEIQSIYNAGSAGKCTAPVANCVAAPSGLVSWWPAEGNALNSAGTNHGTLAGNTIFGPGRVGQTLTLDGNQDAVNLGNPANLRLQTFTIEAWVKRASASRATQDPANINGCLLSYGAGGYGFTLLDDGRLNLTQVEVGAVFSSALRITDTNFHHVALIKSGSTVVFYVDGLAETASPYNPVFTFASSVAIGARGDNLTSSFWGSIDELAVFNRALNASEIEAIYNAGAFGKCGLSPMILTHPQSRTVPVGANVTFSAVATGTSPLSYQWRFNGTNIVAATNTSLNLTNVQLGEAGNYSVAVINALGTITSSNATLTVIPLGCIPAPSGLVSWWPAEGNALNSAGTNHGTLAGNTTFGPGRVGQSFTLDGNQDAANLGNPANLRLQNFTIEAWVRRASASRATQDPANTSGCILAYGAGGYGLTLLDDGRLNLTRVGISAVFSSALRITDTNFHHVVLTKSGSTVVFYIDGAGETASAFTSVFTFTTSVAIGARGDNLTSSFWGSIDELAVFNRALPFGEVQSIYNAGNYGKCGLPPSIVSQPASRTNNVGDNATFTVVATGTSPLSYQWRFNSTDIVGAVNASLTLTNVQLANGGNYSVVVSNAVASVTSSNATLTVNTPVCAPGLSNLVSLWSGEGDTADQASGNNGTLQNGATFAAGKVGQAFSFGSGSYVKVGTYPSLTMSNSFSVDVWVFPTGPGGNPIYGGVIINKEGQYELARFADGTIQWTIANTGPIWNWVNSGFVAPVGQWTHLAWTYDLGLTKTFANGQLVHSYSGSGPVGTVPGLSPNELWIGARQEVSVNQWFQGRLDEVSLYNRALTGAEIQAIYSAGGAGKCGVTNPPSIASQPINKTVTVGSSATFTVSASGSPPLSYQWFFNQTNPVAGGTGATLTLTNVQLNQAGSYSVVVSNIVGSVTSSNAFLTVNFPTAIIRVVSTSAPSAGTVSVPIALVANGNENALGFTLNFSTSALSYASIMLGSGAAGATPIFNTNLVGNGRLGVALALPSGTTFSAGTQVVVRVNFSTALFNNATSTTLTFGDQVTIRQLSDAQGNALPTNFVSGTVSIAAVQYEADVTPRPNGNRAVTITDWVLVGLFAARLDYPTNAGEFQRADCAPLSTLGNGQITTTDWVQAGRYAAGLDSWMPVGGPAAEGPAGAAGAGGPRSSRELRFTNTIFLQGQTSSASVKLAAQGNENALGFSLSFNPATVSFESAVLGNDAAGATLTVNTSQVGAGKLGVLLGLPGTSTFAAGTKEVIKVTMRASAAAAGNSSVTFGDQPIPRELSDATANALTTTYAGGTVMVIPEVPSLKIANVAEGIKLSWPLWASNFVLQVADDALPPSAAWTNTAATPGVGNNENIVTLPLSGGAKFYRLAAP